MDSSARYKVMELDLLETQVKIILVKELELIRTL